MTLRARLAAAFFVVLLGPVVLGVAAVAGAGGTVGPSAERTRLDHAAVAVRLAVLGECERLRAAATITANQAGHPVGSAATGESVEVSASSRRWAICGSTNPAGPPGVRYEALAARVEVRDPAGLPVGYSYATVPLDEEFFQALSTASGAIVSLSSTGETTDSDATTTLRLAPEPGEPIPLRVRVPRARSANRQPVVLAVGLAAGLAAGILAWWLARATTRPLTDLTSAINRVMVDSQVVGDEQAVPDTVTLSSRTASSDRGARGGPPAGGTAGDAAGLAGGAPGGGRRVPGLGRPDEFGRLGGAVQRLITQFRRAQRLSVTDALTGLGNVRHLHNCLRIEVERASRFGHTLGVLVLDLDRFKEINDRYGHRAGDAVLIEFADRVRGVVREVDLVFRQGGEEFVILLPETDLHGCEIVAQRLGTVVRQQPFVVGARRGVVEDDATGLLITITVSIGVAAYPEHASTGTETLDAADEALYAAKAAGRDTYVLARLR